MPHPYPGVKFNPATLFSVIGSIFGGGKPEKTGAFNQSQFRPFSTERVAHEGDGTWRFRDEDLDIDSLFRQDDMGGFQYQDPRTGEWRHDQAGDRYSDPFTWNLRHEQQKIFQGGGPDSDYSQRAFGPMEEGVTKRLPWQSYAMKSGPFYNPVNRDWLKKQDEADRMREEQKRQNQEYSQRFAEKIKREGGWNLADALRGAYRGI